MCSVKYFTFSPEHLSEKVANIMSVELAKRKVWYQKLTQSGTYRGLKVGITTQNYSLVKSIILYSRGMVESSKSLKQNNLSTVSDKDQLSILFPQSE